MVHQLLRATARLRQGLPSEVFVLCGVILLADIVAGIFLPTFSLYARDVGVSLALLGTLNTLGGLTQLVGSLPLGILSDLVGRTRVLIGGLLAFTLALLTLGLVANLPALVLGRVLFSIGSVAVFQIGAAYLGDITAPEQRSTAFGLYTTAMGLGFALGPIIGGQIAFYGGTAQAYLVGSVIGLSGLVLAITRLRERSARRERDGAGQQPPAAPLSVRGRLRVIAGEPDLLLVTFGNMLISLTFAGAVTTFFPVYGREIALTQATIGMMFAVRATVSTLGRFPNGMISRALGSWSVMIGALSINVVAMFGIASTQSPWLLTVLLAAEGLAFGAYLVAGQTYVADHTAPEIRGTAVGFYSMAASVGGALAPLLLGLVADRWGVAQVFLVTGCALVAGLLLSLVGLAMLRRRVRPDHQATT
jgi:DHA1 family tetracycline resistance protein-like MFS transporter